MPYFTSLYLDALTRLSISENKMKVQTVRYRTSEASRRQWKYTNKASKEKDVCISTASSTFYCRGPKREKFPLPLTLSVKRPQRRTTLQSMLAENPNVAEQLSTSFKI